MKPDFAQYGFVHQENLIMACIGGSQAHGAKLGATDDTDWYGLYIPPTTKVLGLEREEHFVFTTGGKLGAQLESEALAAQATSALPDEVDREAISQLLADAHLRFWSSSGA